MYLSRLIIRNYRSIKDLDLRFEKGKNVIVGRNNSGKSNIVRAIDIILGEYSPTYSKSENISVNDFFCWKETQGEQEVLNSTDEIYIWCELTREENEHLNYDEMYKAYGFYVFSQIKEWVQTARGNRPVKEPIRLDKNSIPDHMEAIFAPDEDQNRDKDYVNPKLKHQGTLESQFDNKYCFGFAFRANKTEEGEIQKDMRFLYREDNDSDWVLSFKTPYRNEFLQSAIIPSFRDPSGQLRLTSWTWYGKLIRYLTQGYEQDPDLINAFKGVVEVANGIFEKVNDAVTQSTLDVAFPGTKLNFQFNAESKDDLYKSTLIYIDDGFRSQLTEKGSGIQSATIIGLFSFFTRHVNTLTSALLCIEEPEIYLHPHARRVISDRLDDFLDNNKNQVILTTHSTEFIRTTRDDLNIILVQRNPEGSKAKSINIGQFRDVLLDSNQNELFFADKVIICENLDSYIVRMVARSLFPGELDKQNISVISAGDKDRLPVLANLITELEIPVFIVADFDFLLRDTDDLRNKYEGVKAHKSIASLGEKFFAQPFIFGAEKGPEVFAEVQQLRSKIKNNHEELFYRAKSSTEIPLDLTAFLARMRTNGICVLTGDIESLSKDKEFLGDGKKLKLGKVFDLNGRLLAGENIADIFDITELNEFLQSVIAR